MKRTIRVLVGLMSALVTATVPYLVQTMVSSVSVAAQAPPARTYYLAEGATGSFFDTDILIANPNATDVLATLTFFKEDGTTVSRDVTLGATSRTTIRVDTIDGLEATAVSTLVTSPTGADLVVERTMRWDASGYGAHTDKATTGPAADWYFAEGSQGFFFTFLLLVNPQATANHARVTYLREGASPLVRDYTLLPFSRRTIDAGDEPGLVGTSFGARVHFDQPGVAERAMYFGTALLFTGGHESAGVTAPSTSWFLAEGATGSFFSTFVLLANPQDQDALATLTYLPASGVPIVRPVTIPAGQRVTRNIATEDPALASAAVGARIEADRPIIVERAQYWPSAPTLWYEAHNSFGLTETGTRWGLAEGRVGGPTDDQTYILMANPGATPATVNMTFLRTTGTTVRKSFALAATSRLNVAITGPGSHVPELANEAFGAVIESTEPIAVERSVYSNVNGVIWAAGTNATATPLPLSPLTVTVAAADADASEFGLDPGAFTFKRTGGNPSAPVTVHVTIAGSATNSVDYVTVPATVTIPANQTSATVTITPIADSDEEGPETVRLTITPDASYTMGSPDNATVRIDDSLAEVSVTTTDDAASEAGETETLTFTRTTGGNRAAALAVQLNIGGTASNLIDYTGIGSLVSIPANQTSITRTITPLRDNLIENTETVVVTIAPSTTYTVGAPGSAVVAIEDSVAAVSVEATDPIASEAGREPGTFTFTRTNAGNIAQALTINYIISGTAANGGDYALIPASVTIPANQTSVTRTVTPIPDLLNEGPETVIVTISAGTTYTVGAPSSATITIAGS